jgi:hypothetical protein
MADLLHGDGGPDQQPRLILEMRYLDDFLSVCGWTYFRPGPFPLQLLQRVLPQPLAHLVYQYSHVGETGWTDLFEDLVEFVEDNALPDLVDLE